MRTINFAWILRRLATVLAVVSLTLVLVAAITGILLSFYYVPSSQGAFESLRRITEEVQGGSLVRSLHNTAGNALIYVALLQIFVMFFGRQHQPAWFTGWLSGGFLALSAIGLGWTAMILDWDQIGYWRLKIEMGTLGSLPVLGPILKAVFLGGDGITTTTVAHMYTIHSYLLSVAALTLSVIHLAALVYQERQNIRQLATAEALEAVAAAEKELVTSR
ncbi:cytochrome b N-terminal domain-containing protein [Rivularia sp. UHCC 0363]|uniref:cytochrome b N-terminal domain-containing protein n=1 Tax=Rivularia sp. UHCC 0363 TaxID=3110244 RepID=UPI002B1FB43D|nr:cytochrome b N-terminal domain-containing protein [Rivularia sp. UHCC 0363]MEA5597460.1 cytochrome b N-terminal domain-containing protein [Rivularia sp. UHCC 0363]